MASKTKDRKRTPVSHKVIEKRRRDRINRCLSELGRTVPMALAKQSSGKLEKAEILEMTVQYLRALHSADLPRGREKAGELLSEFASYFHYGYHECMKNLVHYLTTVERADSADSEYARALAFLQSKVLTEPVFAPPEPARASPDYPSPSPAEPLSWAPYATQPAPYPQQHAPGFEPHHHHHHHHHHPHHQHHRHHYVSLLGPARANAFGLHTPQHVAL